jgi:hypothetical protein
VAPSYVGQASIPDYDALQDAAITRVKGGKSFAGFGVNATALLVDKENAHQGRRPVIGIWSTTARQPRPATFVRSSVAPAIANGLREPVAVANRLGAGARFGALIGSIAGCLRRSRR